MRFWTDAEVSQFWGDYYHIIIPIFYLFSIANMLGVCSLQILYNEYWCRRDEEGMRKQLSEYCEHNWFTLLMCCTVFTILSPCFWIHSVVMLFHFFDSAKKFDLTNTVIYALKYLTTKKPKKKKRKKNVVARVA